MDIVGSTTFGYLVFRLSAWSSSKLRNSTTFKPFFCSTAIDTTTNMSYGKKAAERLANKSILITGCSLGIGEAACFELAEVTPNIKLIITARRVEKLEALKLKLEKEYPGIKVLAKSLDISKLETIAPFISDLPQEFADIDILVNNAGLALGKEPVGEVALNDVVTMFQTNVLGLITLTQAVLPIMKKKDSGSIVSIGSIAGLVAYEGGSIYNACKASVRFFMDALRKELISTKIRSILISPGAVKTEFSNVRFRGDDSKADSVYKGTEPLTAEDIAEVIVFTLTRRENLVVAETLVFPNGQASPFHIYRNN